MNFFICKIKNYLLGYRERGGLFANTIIRTLKIGYELVFFCVAYFQYVLNYIEKSKTLANGRFECNWRLRWPCLHDATASTGFDSHYLYHTSWAARILVKEKPEYHIDISSSLNFVSIVSAIVPLKFYDYRPADIKLSNLECGSADLLRLPFDDNSVKSLSCMHVVEHIGLGRYGDAFDSEGDLKAISELTRVLSPGGTLLFVVPVTGRPVLQFNAHRVYSYDQIVHYFHSLKLKEFALITDKGDFLEGVTRDVSDRQIFGCGCFYFKK